MTAGSSIGKTPGLEPQGIQFITCLLIVKLIKSNTSEILM